MWRHAVSFYRNLVNSIDTTYLLSIILKLIGTL